MDTRTGKLVPEAEIPAKDKHHFILVTRDTSRLEKANRQIKMYSPCGCGSGKKFKFCCFKPKADPPVEVITSKDSATSPGVLNDIHPE